MPRALTKRGVFRTRHLLVVVEGATLVVGEGPRPDALARQHTAYADPAQAQAAAAALIAGRLAAGWQEVPAPVSAPQPAAPPAAPSPALGAAAHPAGFGSPWARPGVPPGHTAPGPPVPVPWPDEGLGFTPTRFEAQLCGFTPAEPGPEPDPDADRAWASRHVRVPEYGTQLELVAEPLDAIPSAQRAQWWRRFLLFRGDFEHRFLADRLSHADTGPDAPEPDTALPYGGSDLAVVATRVALEGEQATAAGLLRYADLHLFDSLAAYRAVVAPLLRWPEPPAPELVGSRGGVPQPVVAQLWHALAAAPPQGSAALEPLLTAWLEQQHHGSGGFALAALSALPAARRPAFVAPLAGRFSEQLSVGPWLALTGPAGLPAIEAWVGRAERAEAVLIVETLTRRVSGTAAVATMLRLTGDTRGAGLASAWLAAHPGALAQHPDPVPAKLRPALTGVLRAGLAADPDAYAGATNPAVLDALAEIAARDALPLLTEAPDWWREAAAAERELPVTRGKLTLPRTVPTWATAAALPPLVIDGARLSSALTDEALLSAARGANDAGRSPRPLVAAVRSRLSGVDRDALAAALLAGFLAAGAPANQRAWFVAAGYVGAAGFADQLVPLLRAWPAQGQHQRAVLGLELLIATGTDEALAGIVAISQKAPSQGIKRAAAESVGRLAALRGLTTDQLGDLVAPRGGLDDSGHRDLDFGPRRFRVSLSRQAKPVLRDLDAAGSPTGKPRTTLPAPNASDDPELAATAKAEFGALKKALADATRTQTLRLERAMVGGRSWSAAEHRAAILTHPVLAALTRPLVWRIADGDQVTLARGEDGGYLGLDEEPLTPASAARVTLAHPVQLTAAQREAWTTLLREHDLVSPIEQLDRATYPLPAGQAGIELADLPTAELEPRGLAGTLERLGWTRGPTADRGVSAWFYLPIPAAGLAATFTITPGLQVSDAAGSGPQRVAGARIGPLAQVEQLWFPTDAADWLPWQRVDPALVSEVRRSLALLPPAP